jgi:hypothetical protein
MLEIAKKTIGIAVIGLVHQLSMLLSSVFPSFSAHNVKLVEDKLRFQSI